VLLAAYMIQEILTLSNLSMAAPMAPSPSMLISKL